MSSLFGDREVHRSGTGVLTVGKEIGLDTSKLQDKGFDKSSKDTRILFINPPVDFSVFYSDMDLSDTKSSSPPIGILHLAAIAREYGYKVKLIDAHAESLTVEDLFSRVAEFDPHVVCLTAMTIMIDAAAEIAKTIKNKRPYVITMVGGVHFTAEPIKTLEQYPQFDYGVVGEGEIALIDFLQNVHPSQVKSLAWRDGLTGKIVVNPRREFFKDLDEFPFPAFDLVKDKLFSHYRLSVFGTKHFRSIGLVTSRGCSGHCSFCDLGVVGRGYRIMTAPYLIGNLMKIRDEYNVNDLLFYDDMFTGNRKRLEDFCHAMIDAGNPFTWSCCSRVDFVSYLDILNLMKAAGCHTIEFGVESGCQRILDSMRKNVTKEKIAHVIDMATKAGITTKANFILGHLGETYDSIEETIAFANSLNVNYVQHTHLVPLPGSEIYETANKFGTFDPSWRKMNTLLINFIPNGFTRKDLVYYSKKFWIRFYLRPSTLWRELKRIQSKEDIKRLCLAMKSFIKVTLFRGFGPRFRKLNRAGTGQRLSQEVVTASSL